VAFEADRQSIYKGQVVTLKEGKGREVGFQFHHMPKIAREQLILQPEVIEEIERHTAGFSKHKELLVSPSKARAAALWTARHRQVANHHASVDRYARANNHFAHWQ
jgi:hypothetical protein